MNRKALLARLAAIKSEAKAIVDAADKDGAGKLTDDQTKKFDALMAEREQVEANLKRLDSLEAMDDSAGRVTDPAQPARPEPKTRTRLELGAEGVEKDPMRGFVSAADLGRAVRAACNPDGGYRDPRLDWIRKEAQRDDAAHGEVLAAPTNFHRETSSADGYMVPPAIRQEIWKLVFDGGEGILDAIAPEPTEANSVQLFADQSTPWGATGILAKWAAEGDQMTPSRLLTEARTIMLAKLYAFVLGTDELIADAPRLNERLTAGAARAIRWKSEEAIIEGDGQGKPLGIMNAACLVTVTKESGQATGTFKAENAAKMFSRLLWADARDVFWLINQEVLPQLMTMTIGQQPVWTPPASGFKEAPGGFLLGRPVKFSEHCQSLSTKGDVILVAPNGYYAATKQSGVQFASSIHLYFDYDVEAFRWTFRLGGEPFLSAAIAKNKGSSTLSHFVVIENR